MLSYYLAPPHTFFVFVFEKSQLSHHNFEWESRNTFFHHALSLSLFNGYNNNKQLSLKREALNLLFLVFASWEGF